LTNSLILFENIFVAHFRI